MEAAAASDNNDVATSSPPQALEISPSQTLYINNINEKIKKEVLKKTLYMLFRQYGKIIEIVACKGIKRRGQAWVVFEDVAAATNAMRSKQGFNFYDKPLRIAYSVNKSDIVAKRDGTFTDQGREKYVAPPKGAKRAKTGGDATDPPGAGAASSSSASVAAATDNMMTNNEPHKILFAQKLPDNVTAAGLTALFSAYTGFVEVRLAPGKAGIAFVEFTDHVQATVALQQLNGFVLAPATEDAGPSLLHLTYGKK